jgi:hypothetical protein
MSKRKRKPRSSARRRSDQFKTRRGRSKGPKFTDCAGCRLSDLPGIPVLGLWVDDDVFLYSEEPGASHSGSLFDQTPSSTWSDLPWTF